MTCVEHQKLITNVPIMIAGSEKFGTEDTTIKHLVPLLAYNMLPDSKPIRYENLMKAPGKDGTPRGKFVQLTSQQIKDCFDRAEQLSRAIQYIDNSEEYEDHKRQVQEEEEQRLKAAEVSQVMSDAESKAAKILKNGNPLKFLQLSYEKNHIGHLEIFRSVIYAFCAQSSATSKGIQPEATGNKGSGKTHSITSTLHLFPQDYVYNTSLSPRVLFYDPPKQGSMIYCDEQLDPALVNILKRVMSNFQMNTEHTTVLDKLPVKMVIPKRQVIMGSSVVGIGDDQFGDRVVQVGIINAAEDDTAYEVFESLRRKEGRPEFLVTKQVEICRAMMLHIRKHEFVVKMPDIRFAFNNDRRLINIFYDLVEASAILHYMQRNPVEDPETGVITIVPNEKDIEAAQNFEMFRMASAELEGRLTKSQMALHEAIQRNITTDAFLSEAQIVSFYGKSQQAVRKLLYGEGGSHNKICGGLVERTSWYVCDQQDHTNVLKCKKITRNLNGSFASINLP